MINVLLMCFLPKEVYNSQTKEEKERCLMNQKKLIPFINAENELARNVINLAQKYSCEGADGLYLYNFTGDDSSREEFLMTVRSIEKEIDIPFYIGIYIDRFEDAKKALYKGA